MVVSVKSSVPVQPWHHPGLPDFGKDSSGPGCSMLFSSPQETLAVPLNISVSALHLKQSGLQPRESEYKYLALVDICFSVFMDAESIVPFQKVSGEP